MLPGTTALEPAGYGKRAKCKVETNQKNEARPWRKTKRQSKQINKKGLAK